MKRIRYIVLTALAAASIGVAATPAYACPPDGYCPPCGNEKIDAIWRKLTGHDLFTCPF